MKSKTIARIIQAAHIIVSVILLAVAYFIRPYLAQSFPKTSDGLLFSVTFGVLYVVAYLVLFYVGRKIYWYQRAKEDWEN